MRHEQRGREQADRGQRDAIGVGERVGDRADIRDVPREKAADDEPGDDGCS
jgi:hypothetical protein